MVQAQVAREGGRKLVTQLEGEFYALSLITNRPDGYSQMSKRDLHWVTTASHILCEILTCKMCEHSRKHEKCD